LSDLQVTPSSYQVNEGDSLTTSLSGFTPGATLFFKVSGRGINKKDFAAGGIKGSVKVDANGVASISHTLRADKATEGDESFAIQVFSDKKMRNPLGQSDSITAFDTSVKSTKSKSGGKKDIITGNWSTDNGIILDINILSGDTPYKKYFAVAEEIVDVMTARFRFYGDSNNNGEFDSAADKALGATTIRSQDGIPYYTGTFKYQNGIFDATSGIWDIPVNPFV
jgi:hypothetical protein